MKLSKEEALELYVRHWPYTPIEGTDPASTMTDLLDRIKVWLTTEVVEEQPTGCDTAVDCSSCDCDKTKCCRDEEVEDEEDDVEEEDEVEVPEADGSVDPEDLHDLPNVVSTFPDGKKMHIEFEELDAGPVDLVVEESGDIIKNISHVRREAAELSVFNDQGWWTYDVKKFPKQWTALLAVGKVYAVER